MDLQILPSDLEEARTMWRALWDRSPQRSPFSTLAFAGGVRDALGISTRLLFTRDAGAVAGGLMLFEKRTGPFRRLIVPPYTPYTSPLLAPGCDPDRTLATLLSGVTGRYVEAAVHLAPGQTELPPGAQAWSVQTLHTYLLRLGTMETMMPVWSSGVRWRLRKRADLYAIEEAPEAVTRLTDLVRASYERHGRRPPPDPGALIGSMLEAEFVRLFVARRQDSGTIEAAVAFLTCGNVVYDWIAGSTPGAAMTVLLGTVLPRFYEKGFEWLDFVGANTPSIATFKGSFGPELAPYLRLEQQPGRLWRLVQALRK